MCKYVIFSYISLHTELFERFLSGDPPTSASVAVDLIAGIEEHHPGVNCLIATVAMHADDVMSTRSKSRTAAYSYETVMSHAHVVTS